jgi:hypothetical protein
MALVFAIVHLLLVTFGAFSFSFPLPPGLGEVVSYYGEMSGASNGYGFFSPGIQSQIRAVFDITDSKNRTITVPIMTGEVREVDLRVGDIIEQFFNDRVDNPKKYQRVLSASLCGAMFGLYPEAQSVRIRLEQLTPLSMEEYRNGATSTLQTIYSAKFVRRKKYVQERNK